MQGSLFARRSRKQQGQQEGESRRSGDQEQTAPPPQQRPASPPPKAKKPSAFKSLFAKWRRQLTHQGHGPPPPPQAAAAPPAHARDRTCTTAAAAVGAHAAGHAGAHEQRPPRPAAPPAQATAAATAAAAGGASDTPAKAVLQQQIERLIATSTQPPPPTAAAGDGAAQQPLRAASWGGGAMMSAPGAPLCQVTSRAPPPRSPSAPGLASSARHQPATSGPAAATSSARHQPATSSGATHPAEAPAAAAAASEEDVGTWLRRASRVAEKLTGGLMAADGSLQALTARGQLVQGILANLPPQGGAARAPQDGKQARLINKLVSEQQRIAAEMAALETRLPLLAVAVNRLAAARDLLSSSVAAAAATGAAQQAGDVSPAAVAAAASLPPADRVAILQLVLADVADKLGIWDWEELAGVSRLGDTGQQLMDMAAAAVAEALPAPPRSERGQAAAAQAAHGGSGASDASEMIAAAAAALPGTTTQERVAAQQQWPRYRPVLPPRCLAPDGSTSGPRGDGGGGSSTAMPEQAQGRAAAPDLESASSIEHEAAIWAAASGGRVAADDALLLHYLGHSSSSGKHASGSARAGAGSGGHQTRRPDGSAASGAVRSWQADAARHAPSRHPQQGSYGRHHAHEAAEADTDDSGALFGTVTSIFSSAAANAAAAAALRPPGTAAGIWSWGQAGVPMPGRHGAAGSLHDSSTLWGPQAAAGWPQGVGPLPPPQPLVQAAWGAGPWGQGGVMPGPPAPPALGHWQAGNASSYYHPAAGGGGIPPPAVNPYAQQWAWQQQQAWHGQQQHPAAAQRPQQGVPGAAAAPASADGRAALLAGALAAAQTLLHDDTSRDAFNSCLSVMQQHPAEAGGGSGQRFGSTMSAAPGNGGMPAGTVTAVSEGATSDGFLSAEEGSSSGNNAVTRGSGGPRAAGGSRSVGSFDVGRLPRTGSSAAHDPAGAGALASLPGASHASSDDRTPAATSRRPSECGSLPGAESLSVRELLQLLTSALQAAGPPTEHHS